MTASARTDRRRPSELVSATEVARALGVERNVVSNWRARTRAGRLTPPFPAPWYEPAAVHGLVLFVRAEVEAWAVERAAVERERDARTVARLERQLAAVRARANGGKRSSSAGASR